MISLKRSGGSVTGLRASKPLTHSLAAKSAPAASGPAYAALGFIARTSDGSLLRMNAVSGRTTQITYRRRKTLVAA